MKKNSVKIFLVALGLSLVSMPAVWGQYKEVHVKAPFQMEPIKEYVYPDRNFSVVDFGAVKGGIADNTKSITAAINACHKAGGGRVVIPEGEWLTGPVHLKSNVNLYLSENAVLCFTDNPSDYLPAVMTSWVWNVIITLRWSMLLVVRMWRLPEKAC